MASAKDLIVKPISSADARAAVKKYHYSGKVVNNSKLHLGVFLNGGLEGVMSFGSPMKKHPIRKLVADSAWNSFMELNRMAFSDRLPRNSESRALSVAFRMIKQHYPHIEWIISFADGTQCGDGAIYRAAGFHLTQIKQNTSLWVNNETGEKWQDMQFFHTGTLHERKSGLWSRLASYQLRYIYFLNPAAKARLTCDILPFTKIAEMGASMYKGESIKRDKQAFTESIGVAAGQNRPSRSTIPDGAQICP